MPRTGWFQERLINDGPYPCQHKGIEKSAEYIETLYLALIDYAKAFDPSDNAPVRNILRNQGFEEAYIRLLEDIYKDKTVTNTLHKQSEEIPIRKGVRQGYAISPNYSLLA